MHRRAFTLAELLVVVAIIMLLAAILMPSINAAGEMSRRATCLINLRQLGNASHMFAGGNNQMMLPGSLDGLAWFQLLASPGREFIGKGGGGSLPVTKWAGGTVLECPSDRPAKAAKQIESAGKGISYFHNGMLAGTGSVKFTELKRPSQTVLLGEKMGMADAGVVGANDSITSPPTNATFASDRHFVGSRHRVGMLFTDGRAAEMERDIAVSGTQNGSQVLWWNNN
jgi:hypothetical protein